MEFDLLPFGNCCFLFARYTSPRGSQHVVFEGTYRESSCSFRLQISRRTTGFRRVPCCAANEGRRFCVLCPTVRLATSCAVMRPKFFCPMVAFTDCVHGCVRGFLSHVRFLRRASGEYRWPLFPFLLGRFEPTKEKRNFRGFKTARTREEQRIASGLYNHYKE